MINDNDNTRFRGGLPALKWLAKQDSDAARAVAAELRNTRLQTHAKTA